MMNKPNLNPPKATIVVVPRERFSVSQRSLDMIYEKTDNPFALIYVDGGSPRPTKRYLEKQSQEKRFKLIRTEHYLTPNEARNLGARQVETEFVVFIDNDVLVKEGWLEALVNCAEETGAWVVGPLYLMGEIEQGIVHMAGGLAHVVVEDGKRRFYETQAYYGNNLEDVQPQLHREPCEMVEFHCVLVRNSTFPIVGKFDENLKSALENPDFCMLVRHAGGSIYFEPAAIVSYLPPYAHPMNWSDLRYFILRWSYLWNYANLEPFRKKWKIPENDPSLIRQFSEWERWRTEAVIGSVNQFRRIFGRRLGTFIHRKISKVERKVNKWVVRDRRRPPQNTP